MPAGVAERVSTGYFVGPKWTVERSDLMIRRIIYVSRSLIGADPDEIAAVVMSSIRWNTEVGVTGMLWADGLSFAQVIEGTPDKIGATMDRIRTDRRHTDIEVLFDRNVLSRQFGTWSMRRAGDDEASTHGTAFLMGFMRGERTEAAQRVYEIVLATGG
jgi:hypothetical protein